MIQQQTRYTRSKTASCDEQPSLILEQVFLNYCTFSCSITENSQGTSTRFSARATATGLTAKTDEEPDEWICPSCEQ